MTQHSTKPIMLIPDTFDVNVPAAISEMYDVVRYDHKECDVDAATLARASFLVTLGHPKVDRLRAMIDQIPTTNKLVIQSGFAGVDIFLNPPLHPDIALCRGEGLHNAPTAEHAALLALSSLADMQQMFRDQAQRLWDRTRYTRNLSTGHRLERKRVLIVGYGSIGKDIARRLNAFDVASVEGVVTTLRRRQFDIPVHEQKDLNTIAKNFDVIVSVVPGGAGTTNMFDMAFFQSMHKNAFFINVGRGTAVVEEDLDAALRQGIIKGAAIDVARVENAEKPDADWLLWTTPNLTITPHVAGGGPNYFAKAWALIEQQCKALRSHGNLEFVVMGPKNVKLDAPKLTR